MTETINRGIIIAIDGPEGVGRSTVVQALAKMHILTNQKNKRADSNEQIC